MISIFLVTQWENAIGAKEGIIHKGQRVDFQKAKGNEKGGPYGPPFSFP
jgi:hypothetical protein